MHASSDHVQPTLPAAAGLLAMIANAQASLCSASSVQISHRPSSGPRGVFGRIARSLSEWAPGQQAKGDRSTHEARDVDAGIPATFTSPQGQWILELETVHAWNEASAFQLLEAWTPRRFSPDQAECIEALLQLSPQDLRATLADAMEPCELRDRLRMQQRLSLAH